MAPHFILPRTLQDLEEEHEYNCVYVHNPLDIAFLALLPTQRVRQNLYSLIRGYGSLPQSCKLNLLDSLRSYLSVLLPNVDSLSRIFNGPDEEIPVLDRVASHRNAFKIYTFFLLNVVLAEESNTGSKFQVVAASTRRKKQPVNSWNWEPER